MQQHGSQHVAALSGVVVHLRARCARRRLRALLPRTPLAVIQMACPMQVSYQGLQQLVRKLTAATVCCRHKLVMQARRQLAARFSNIWHRFCCT